MKKKYVIIGAGISGLSFASKLKSDDYIVIEKENEVGGLCRTIKKDGFTWDYAGHFFHFKDERIKEYFRSFFKGEDCVEKSKNTKIYFNGKMIDYPFQANIHQLEKSDFIDCLYDLYFKQENAEYNSFKEMLYGKFGKGICERFLIPYNEKLYACDLDKLDQDAMGRFFPYADLEAIIRNMKEQNCKTYNDKFMYPLGGAITVIQHLLKDVNKDNIYLNEAVEEINIKDKYITTSKRKIQFEYLINTIPLNFFSDLISDYYKKIQFSWNKVLVLNMGFDKESVDKTVDWIYFPDKDINFYRVGFYNNILNQSKLSVYVEIGYANNQIVNIKKEIKETLNNLKKCNLIDQHKLVACAPIIMDPAYVHISTSTKEDILNLMKELEKNNVYSIGRYGAWTYCSMEDCYIQAMNLALELD